MYPPLRQAEWIKFIGLLITSENFCTLKIQKKFGDLFTLALSPIDSNRLFIIVTGVRVRVRVG